MLNESHEEGLRGQLTVLHELLEQVGELDPPTKEAMRVVVSDLNRVLETDSEEHDWPQLRKRWHEAALDFESHHPRLAQAVEEISAILANAGI